MIIPDLQNELNSNFFFQNEFRIQFTHYFAILLINLVAYLYIFVKFYKVMCYSKMTFEWLPMINPYEWPFCWFQEFTQPYFFFWSQVFPSVRFKNSSIEVSGILALEGLNSVIYLCTRSTQSLISLLEETEKAFEGA
jgi:hypothetical protein